MILCAAVRDRRKPTNMSEMSETDTDALHQRLHTLRVEHRDLDDVITRLVGDPVMDQLTLKRLKKRKLALKDLIQRIESALIPNLDA